ncbi:Hypp6321 [Branchiostoma lanceolatum]|uniref:Hypp6321 protein n=1 Tax=Branchiostoma lanceolatum TaxID=7740 RepID=A0A8J9YSZ7_BRALA|nr:Hypp6321 [Branchiostoma lanceolatum]
MGLSTVVLQRCWGALVFTAHRGTSYNAGTVSVTMATDTPFLSITMATDTPFLSGTMATDTQVFVRFQGD